MSTTAVGIAGATGYLGQELVRLLHAHPHATVTSLASTSSAGKPFAAVAPRFTGVADLPELTPLAEDAFDACDVVLLAAPHGVAKALSPGLLEAGKRVIDLSGDHRLADARSAGAHYGGHGAAQAEAVYGLPELNAPAIRAARLVANPGCYPTASALALLPLAEAGFLTGAVVVDAKSGVSGAGRTPRDDLHYAEMSGSVRAYGVGSHRHGPEIAETLARAAGAPVPVAFTPHVVPSVRGILATCYAPVAPGVTQGELDDLYAKRYADAPFVHVVAHEPDTALVAGSNACHVRPHATDGFVIVTSALDNLVKGGAGQAVQNLNLMLGLDETTGLATPGGAPR